MTPDLRNAENQCNDVHAVRLSCFAAFYTQFILNYPRQKDSALMFTSLKCFGGLLGSTTILNSRSKLCEFGAIIFGATAGCAASNFIVQVM